jgi:hypothetical protein
MTLDKDQKEQAIAPYQQIVNAWVAERNGSYNSGNKTMASTSSTDQRPSLGKTLTFENDILPTIKVALDEGASVQDIMESIRKQEGISPEVLQKAENYLRLNEKGLLEGLGDWFGSVTSVDPSTNRWFAEGDWEFVRGVPVPKKREVK